MGEVASRLFVCIYIGGRDGVCRYYGFIFYVCKGIEGIARVVIGLAYVVVFRRFVDLGNRNKMIKLKRGRMGNGFLWEVRSWLLWYRYLSFRSLWGFFEKRDGDVVLFFVRLWFWNFFFCVELVSLGDKVSSVLFL